MGAIGKRNLFRKAFEPELTIKLLVTTTGLVCDILGNATCYLSGRRNCPRSHHRTAPSAVAISAIGADLADRVLGEVPHDAWHLEESD